MKLNWLHGLVFITCLSCGVNTGNPTGATNSGATMVLNISEPPAGGGVTFNILDVSLFSNQETVSIQPRQTISAKSGQQVTLFSNRDLPHEFYDTIKISLDTSVPMQYIDQNGAHKPVYIPPVEVYETILECSGCLTDSDSLGSAQAILLSGLESQIKVTSSSDQVFTVAYDFSSKIVALASTHTAIQTYFRSLNLPSDTLIFDALISDSEVQEFIPSEQTCSDGEEDCQASDQVFFSFVVNYPEADKFCFFTKDKFENSSDDQSCSAAKLIGAVNEDSFESFTEPGDYVLVLLSQGIRSLSVPFTLDPSESLNFEVTEDGQIISADD